MRDLDQRSSHKDITVLSVTKILGKGLSQRCDSKDPLPIAV